MRWEVIMQAVKWCDRGGLTGSFRLQCSGQTAGDKRWKQGGRFGGRCRSPGETREEVVRFWMLLKVEPPGFAHKAGCVW